MKPMPARFKARAQFLEVIDLTIEDEPDGFVFIAHWLAAGCGYVDNGKPIVGERDVLRNHGGHKTSEAKTVWPAMPNRAGHPLDRALKFGSVETPSCDS